MANDVVEQRADETLRRFSPEDSNLIIQATTDRVLDQIKGDFVPQILESMRRLLGHSDALILATDELAQRTGETDAVIRTADELAKTTGETSEDVLLKALTLYEAALDAKKKGQRLILAGPDYHFIREIVGFDPAGPEPAGRDKVAR